jgi:stage III sporulation protein AC
VFSTQYKPLYRFGVGVQAFSQQYRNFFITTTYYVNGSDRQGNLKKESKKMDVDLVFKIAAIGIIIALLSQLIDNSGRKEQALMTTIAGMLVVLGLLVNEIAALFNTVKSLFGF